MPENIEIENQPPNNNVQLLSTDVKEIISHRPHWIVRYGTTLFLLIVIGLITVSFFINYPDIVTVPAVFSGINAPKEVKVKLDGRLVALHVAEGQTVQANAVLGLLESTARHNEVIRVSAVAENMDALLQSGQTERAVILLDSVLKEIQTINFERGQTLGELQPAFQTFLESFYLFKQYLANGYYLTKRKLLDGDIKFLQRQNQILEQQKILQLEDLELSKKTLEANSQLLHEKVISALDYRNEKSKLIAKELSIPQVNAALVANESSQHEKEKEILQLENEITQQKNIFWQALNSFKAGTDDWKQKYLLRAPIAGVVSFTSFIQVNEQLKSGRSFCYIAPGNAAYYATINIPQQNFGKVKQGQKVILKIKAYPYQEFGWITGQLTAIATVPSDSGYTAKVSLTNGFTTSYQKQLLYKEGLKAEGQIITANLKLSDRLLNQFYSLIKNRP